MVFFELMFPPSLWPGIPVCVTTCRFQYPTTIRAGEGSCHTPNVVFEVVATSSAQLRRVQWEARSQVKPIRVGLAEAGFRRLEDQMAGSRSKARARATACVRLWTSSLP